MTPEPRPYTEPRTHTFEPGTLVAGPFYSDGKEGVGIVVAPARALWTRVGDCYVPVKVVVGDRAAGGYRPENLHRLADRL